MAMEAQGTQPRDPHEKARHQTNLDRSAMVGFSAVAAVGFFTTLNRIREKFEDGFVRGWNGKVETPFKDIFADIKKLDEANLRTYEQSAKTLADGELYRSTIRSNALKQRTQIAERLMERFNIPTNGWDGWTTGTWKRFEHLAPKTRVATGATAMGLGLVTWVGYALLRHGKYTLDQIDAKLDHLEHRGR